MSWQKEGQNKTLHLLRLVVITLKALPLLTAYPQHTFLLFSSHPTNITSLTSLTLSDGPNSITSGLKLPLSTNNINYTNP